MKIKVKAPPEARRLGYARVSTCGQTFDAQFEQLHAQRCVRMYREKASGERRKLVQPLKALAPSDVVMVTGSTG